MKYSCTVYFLATLLSISLNPLMAAPPGVDQICTPLEVDLVTAKQTDETRRISDKIKGILTVEKQSATPYHVVMVTWRGLTKVEEGFLEYMVEQQIPVRYTHCTLDRNRKRTPAIVVAIRKLKPDLVYTWGTGTALGIIGTYTNPDPLKYITEIPVLFTMVSYPVRSKIVPSFESSGRNVTGTTHVTPLDAQLNAIKAYRPFDKLGIIFNPQEPNSVINVEELRRSAPDFGFELLVKAVPMGGDGKPRVDVLPKFVEELKDLGADYLYIGPDSFVGDNSKLITVKGNELDLPTFTSTERELKTAKPLFGLVTRYKNLGRLNGFKAQRILEDKFSPRDMPIQRLTRFSYVVNLSVARELKFYPPMLVLKYAELIE